MSNNRFGKLFCWTSFGESHGDAMGVVIDGCPAGVLVDEDLLITNLAKRRPGQVSADGKNIVSARDEKDIPKILSGVFEGKTLGTPIAVLIENKDQRSQDYEKMKKEPRIGHADDMWQGKFGHWDHRGGGRASARETVSRVIAGSFAEMLCKQVYPETQLEAKLKKVGPLDMDSANDGELTKLLLNAKEQGESYGAIVSLEIKNPPQFLGQPVFHKLKSDFASAFMGINACNGVEFGDGFAMALKRGSKVHTMSSSKNYGGIRGGISTGETISFQLAFKPTSSINDVAKKGRHDPCIALRARPVIESMAWVVLVDHILLARLDRV